MTHRGLDQCFHRLRTWQCRDQTEKLKKKRKRKEKSKLGLSVLHTELFLLRWNWKKTKNSQRSFCGQMPSPGFPVICSKEIDPFHMPHADPACPASIHHISWSRWPEQMSLKAVAFSSTSYFWVSWILKRSVMTTKRKKIHQNFNNFSQEEWKLRHKISLRITLPFFLTDFLSDYSRTIYNPEGLQRPSPARVSAERRCLVNDNVLKRTCDTAFHNQTLHLIHTFHAHFLVWSGT